MPQFARPDADLQVHQWQICPACVGDLYAQIDEVVPNDSDFIQTVPNPQAAVYEASLSNVNDPLIDTGHVLRYRFQKDEPSLTRRIDLTVTLLQGASIIAQFVHTDIPGSITQVNQNLTALQVALITDYSDLRIEFVANAPVGTGQARQAIVTWVELEVPDADVTSTSTTPPPQPPSGHDPGPKRRLKTLDVHCSQQVHAIGSLNVNFANFIHSLVPMGEAWQIPGLTAQIVGISPGTVVTPNKICTMFNVSVQLRQFGVPFPDDTPYIVSVPSNERCPGAGLGGGQPVVQYHDIQSQTSVVPSNVGGFLQITIWVMIDACLVVSEETVLQVVAKPSGCG